MRMDMHIGLQLEKRELQWVQFYCSVSGREQDHVCSIREWERSLMREIKGLEQLLWITNKGDDEAEKAVSRVLHNRTWFQGSCRRGPFFPLLFTLITNSSKTWFHLHSRGRRKNWRGVLEAKIEQKIMFSKCSQEEWKTNVSTLVICLHLTI